MADGTDRAGRSIVALAIVGVILVLVAVSAAFAFIRPSISPRPSPFRVSAPSEDAVDADADVDAALTLAEENESVLESTIATAPPTSTVEASGTVASHVAVSSAAAAGGAGGSSDVPGGAAGQVGPTVPGGGGATTGGGGGFPSARESGLVVGVVTHAVWGTSLPGVRVTLSQGGSGTTNVSGEYALATPAMRAGSSSLYTVAVDASSAGLRSFAPTARVVKVSAAERVRSDFQLYFSSESAGTDWRTASWWSRWRSAYSSDQMGALVSKISHASAEFSGLDAADADAVLASRSSRSALRKARAEYLALWLDIASARLGFDVRTRSANVRDWGTVGGGSVLSLARGIDAVFSSGADANWNDVRRACTGDSTASD